MSGCRCHGSEVTCPIPLDETGRHLGPCRLVPCPDCTDVGEPAEGPFDPFDCIREDMRELLYDLYDSHIMAETFGYFEFDDDRRESEGRIDQLVTAYRALDGDMLAWSHARETIARRYADV